MYPLKFKPIVKKLLWGSESWVVSAVKGNESVVANGTLRDNNLAELSEVYLDDFLGEESFGRYGDRFPLLVKFIDAKDRLSIQVHPDDALARKRYGTNGKTEMWYIVSAAEGAYIYAGFKEKVSERDYLMAVAEGRLVDLLARYDVKAGDAYYIPAGTIHAIGEGCLIAEIQQSSDVTYRIDDWGRLDDEGNPRMLHTQEAVAAIDFAGKERIVVTAHPAPNSVAELVSCPYFTTNQIALEGKRERDYGLLDSFVILICTQGKCTIQYEDGVQPLGAMEAVLLPADINNVTLSGEANLLEVSV